MTVWTINGQSQLTVERVFADQKGTETHGDEL